MGKQKSVIPVAMLLLVAIAMNALGVMSISYAYLNLSGNHAGIEKFSYHFGEPIRIETDISSEDYELYISSGNDRYYYSNASSIVFLPEKTGNYSLVLQISNETGMLNFTVTKSNLSFILTDKEIYNLGEVVSIYLSNIGEDHSLSVSSPSSTYNFFGMQKDRLEFRPQSVGLHSIIAKNKNGSGSIAKNFTVSSLEEQKNRVAVHTDKKLYELGEAVTVSLDFAKNDSYEIYINTEDSIYRFLGVAEDSIIFRPRNAGLYTIKVEEANKVLASYSFEVIGENETYDKNKAEEQEPKAAEKQEHEFWPDENAFVDFDLRNLSESRRSILDILFGASPIDKIVFHVEGHEDDINFRLSAEKLRDEHYRVSIAKNQNIKAGIYFVVAEITIDSEVFHERKQFRRLPGEDTLNQGEEAQAEDAGIIKKYADYSFSVHEEPLMHADFTSIINADRGILELALKSTKLEQLTAYVEGHELDARFNISLEHLEYDNFSVKISRNEELGNDVYRLVAVGVYGNKSYFVKKIFSWGINDSRYFLQRLEALDSKIFDEANKSTGASGKKIQDYAIHTDKKEYFVGENVTITSNSVMSKLRILHDNYVLYEAQFVPGISFAPLSEGMYAAEAAFENLDGVLAANFSVRANTLLNLSTQKEKKIIAAIKDSKNRSVDYDIEFFNNSVSFRKIRERSGILGIFLDREGELADGQYDVEIKPVKSHVARLRISKLRFSGAIELGIDDVPESIRSPENIRWDKVYAVNPEKLVFEQAVLDSVAQGNALFKCRDWSFELQECQGEWEKIMDLSPGDAYSVTLTSSDPAFAEATIEVINVQSYPTVGGQWQVRFNTTGTANLTITAYAGTSWSNLNENNDLKFLEISCNGNPLSYEWVENGPHNSSVFVEDFSCSGQAHESSKVLTQGTHILKFQFGSSIAYANNFALAGNVLLDNTNDDFTQGALFRTNISGPGSDANVTLNFTTISTFNIHNSTGNFTSRVFDTESNFSLFDRIAWTSVLHNSSDVLGYAMDTGVDDIGAFYRNGSIGADSSQADLNSAVGLTSLLLAYTIPAGWDRNDIIGFAWDDDGTADVFAFFMNGSVAVDSSQADLASNIGFTAGTSSFTIPSGFNASGIIGFALDTDNAQAAVFFRNGSYMRADSEAAPFAFSAVLSYSLPSGFNANDAIGTAYDSTANQIAMFFRNGSYVSDNAQADFTTGISFNSALSASYHADANVTESANITLHTRASNNSIDFTPWSGIYINSDGSGQVEANKARYIQYKAVFTTPDKFMTPYLENVSVNYTAVLSAPVITNVAPSNNSLAKSPVTLSLNTNTAASCKYDANQAFNYDSAGTLFSITGGTSHSSSIPLSEGTYSYYMKCRDEAGNTNNASSQGSTAFSVDSTAPNISIGYPQNNSNATTELINFTWTAFDNYDNSLSCNLTVDNSVLAAGIVSANGTISSYNTNISYGQHSWNVSCSDDASNSAASFTGRFESQIRKSVISMQTSSDSYKNNMEVNLTSSARWADDIGSNEKSTTMDIVFFNSTFDAGTEGWSYVDDIYQGTSNPDGVAGTYSAGGQGCLNLGSCLFTDIQFAMTGPSSGGWNNSFNLTSSALVSYSFFYNYTQEGTPDPAEDSRIYARNTSNNADILVSTYDGNTPNPPPYVWIGGTYSYNATLAPGTYEFDVGAWMSDTTANDEDTWAYFDNILVKGHSMIQDNDGNTSYAYYESANIPDFAKISDIDISVEVTHYNASGSIEANNAYPDLEVQLYNGTSYAYSYLCSLDDIYGDGGNNNYNCSSKITNPSVLASWNNSASRKLRIRGVYIDNENFRNDTINWSSVHVEIETPSKLENYAKANLTGRLLLEVMNSSGNTVSVVYNQTAVIANGTIANLSQIWNSNAWNSGYYPLGNYRAHAAMLDSDYTLLRNSDGTYINESYEFALDYLRINPQSPLNNSVADATSFWANITLSFTTFASGGFCSYSIDNVQNVTMPNDTGTHFYNLASNVSESLHNITFYCNDTSGDISSLKLQFNATDQQPPSVSLLSPQQNGEMPNGNITFVFNASDTVSRIESCTLEFQFADNQTNSSIIEDASQSFRIYNLENGGPYTWRVRCADDSMSGNSGYSGYSSFIVGADTDAPIVTLRNPADNYNTSNNDVIFDFRANDLTSTIANCSLMLNNVTNQTNSSIAEQGPFPFTFNNFTVHDMADGNYTWKVSCIDTSNSKNAGNSSARKLTVNRDLDAPAIQLTSPQSGATDTDGIVPFHYNVTDASSNIASCSLIINNTANSTAQNPAKGQTNIFSLSRFNDGFYIWQVNCTDDSFDSNRNSSEVRNFTVSRLINLKAGISSDKAAYEQGTQQNENITISLATRDEFGNAVNATVDADVIEGNTSLRWWNASWKRRKPVYLSEAAGIPRGNDAIAVNITGLSGYIASCANELRIIRNVSSSLYEIPFNLIDGDNSGWCYIKFRANVSANAANKNDYHAYYNNSAAQNPAYEAIQFVRYALFSDDFEDAGLSGWVQDPQNDWARSAARSYPNGAGSAGISGATASSYLRPNMTFNISSFEIVNISYAWYIDGALDDNPQDLIVFSLNNGSQWTLNDTIRGEGTGGTASGEENRWVLENVTLAKKFFTQNFTFMFNATIDSAGEQGNLDYLNVTGFRHGILNVSSSTGAAQQLITSSTEDTGADGSSSFSLGSSGLAAGLYSAVSFVSATNYNNGTNYTNFEIVTDRTSPSVNLASPADNDVSVVSSVSFAYNVSDSFSGIASCSLILNSTINATNNSVAENARMNFTLQNIQNGVYSWNVNCTDDSSSGNKGSGSARLLSVAVDTTAPIVTLLNPQNNYNDTNRNVSFNYSVTDDLTSTADCSIYINSTLNTTQSDVATDGSTKTISNIPLFSNGAYTWYVNCTDDSLARNSDFSETRNFTVIEDIEAPAISLVFPQNNSHLTNGNVSIKYNVTDLISGIASCSLVLNSTINATNNSVAENAQLNFTLYNLDGSFSWSINCTDASENANRASSETRNFLVAPDLTPPVIRLDFPPDNAQLNPSNVSGNVTFRYNVSDLASGISSCSLYINQTLNVSKASVAEDTLQNFSLNMSTGAYAWYVNCTDNSLNFNFNKSETRALVIGEDMTPPEVNLLDPANNFNDTDGMLLFRYTANDIASDVAYCSIIINDAVNLTNASIAESMAQNFTITGFSNGTYVWYVNCTDTAPAANRANSSSRAFNVIIDAEKPIVNLIAPQNSTIDSNGNVALYYNASDAISSINSCSLIMNGKANQTSISVAENMLLNFSLSSLADAEYNWSVNCTDSSDNSNTASSEFRKIDVINDNQAPLISLLAPPNNSIDTNGNITFNYTVTDALSGITSCTLNLGNQQYTSTSVAETVLQQFNVTSITTADYSWNIACTDNSENSNAAVSQNRNISVVIDNDAPLIQLIAPLNYTQELSNSVAFFYNVSDLSDIRGCSLIMNGTINQSNSSLVTKNARLNFTASNMPNGTFSWQVNCTDDSESRFVGSSEQRIVVAGPDVAGPLVNLVSPPDGIQDPGGNFTFVFNASDFASAIASCSLRINGTVNQTAGSIAEDINMNFTLNNTAIGVYTWQVSCIDNSTGANTGFSAARNFIVGQDLTAPTVTLASPANNTFINSNEALFEYSSEDFASAIANCTLLINGRANLTNYSISEASSNFFRLANIDDGNYNWSVSCADSSASANIGYALTLNFTVFAPKQINADVYLDAASYEQGQVALVTANVTNSTGNGFDADVYIDIIKGNTTAPFFDSRWNYRIPVGINAAGITRKNQLAEIDVNFTDILAGQLGISGMTFDVNSIRVVEWSSNKSAEIVYQSANAEGFDAASNAFVTISWILNGTTQENALRNYFVYFDVTENGAKTAADYSSYAPDFKFSGSSKTAVKDGSPNSADYVTISKNTESIAMQFANGQGLANQQNIKHQGAGSIWNITANGTRTSNYYDSIVPMAVYSDYFLNQNRSANITSGPVYSKIGIKGYLNGTSGTNAELNYTIWFAGNEIFIKAELSAEFLQANNEPLSLFNNLWFAYLFDYESDWTDYAKLMNSSSFVQTHRYHLPNADIDTTNQFNTGDWYSEYSAQKGSVNIYMQNFTLNSVQSAIGAVSYDDWYNPGQSKTTESDGVGFNLNSDQAIAAGDRYSLTAWMILSGNKTSLRAADLKNNIENPPSISIGKAHRLVNRTIGTGGVSGIFSFSWNSANKEIGNYTATAIANKTYYKGGADFYNFVINADTASPAVMALTPEGFISTANITFAYNVSETNSVAACRLIVNNKVNATNSSITNNAQNTIKSYNFAEGTYNWSVNCTDAAGNTGSSGAKNITVDLTKPQVTLSAPLNGSTFNYTNVEFNFTAFDNFAPVLLCNISVDGSVQKNVNASSGALANTTIALNQGVHSWNVACSDSAGNSNASQTRTFTIDLGVPTITLNSPSNNSFTRSLNLSLVYTPNSLTLAACTLIVNGAANQTNTSPTAGMQNTFRLENRSEGLIEWAVNCSDISNDIGSSEISSIFIDLTSPVASLLAPENGKFFNTSAVQFNFTATDNLDSILDCNITINGTINNTQAISALDGGIAAYDSSGFTDGLFAWNVTCADGAGNSNKSITRNFTVQEKPGILIGGPANSTRSKNRNQIFFFTPRDNSGDIASCSLVMNNNLNATNSLISSGQQNSISLQNLDDGIYNWTVNCTDAAGNTAINETQKTIYIDNLGPSINLSFPSNGQSLNQNDINFSFTATDQFALATLLNCSLVLDGIANVSGITVTSGSTNITLISGLSDGTHQWNVTCADDLSNANTSSTATFTINRPDLLINSSGISLNYTALAEGYNVTISAIVHNTGGVPAANVLVKFYDGNPSNGGVQIDTDRTISSIGFGQSASVNVTWLSSIGLHEIFASADPAGSILELDEANNNASINVTIPIYHIVTGNVSGNLLLESIGNRTVFVWNTSSATSGNIFAVDSESSVVWTNLTAIGRTLSGGNASDDWEELDRIMNTTQYPDSINRTFTSNYVPLNVTSFIVFANAIGNVSVANSTNNSEFTTGILWDRSDDAGDSQYNGSEDIAFITEIRRNTPGKYGIYDFELRVPAYLKKYKGPDVDSVAFYVELK